MKAMTRILTAAVALAACGAVAGPASAQPFPHRGGGFEAVPPPGMAYHYGRDGRDFHGRPAPWRIIRRGDETDYEMPDGVLFPLDSARISDRAYDIIADIADDARARPRARVVVEGYTDTSGAAGHNQELSEARAQAVADVLARHGIAPERIRAQGFGEMRLAVPTPDGVREPANRRVVIRIFGGRAFGRRQG